MISVVLYLYSIFLSSGLSTCHLLLFFFSFFNYTTPTEIYTLSLHDALPILSRSSGASMPAMPICSCAISTRARSEEHTSELQSRPHLVCRLLLEKKKKHPHIPSHHDKINDRYLSTQTLAHPVSPTLLTAAYR